MGLKTSAANAASTSISKLPSKRKAIFEDHATANTAKRPKKTTHTAKQRTVLKANNAKPTEELQIFVCGDGSSGELGLGTRDATDVATPRLNSNLSNVVNLACGGMHGVALTSEGVILTWGVNDQGTLGRNTALSDSNEEDSDTGMNPLESNPGPVPTDKFLPGTRVVQVAAGDSTTFVLTDDGFVYGWGTFRDDNGIYGFTLDPQSGSIVKIQREPRLIEGLKNIISLSVGADYALALDVKGLVVGWGTGQQGQLGHRILNRHRPRALLPSPVGLPPRKKFVSIHAGINHAFAIDINGDTWTWGLNNFGQTGITTGAGEGDAIVMGPKRVPSLRGEKMKMIAGGNHHSTGVTHDGQCLAWGRMDSGQSGLDLAKLPINDPNIVSLNERQLPCILLRPTALPLLDCVYAAAGSDHSIAVTSDGKAHSWGFNVNYQCGQGSSDDILVAKLINGRAVREQNICWAGAGGQFSMLASKQQVE